MSKTRRCRWPPEEFNPHREQRAEPAADAWKIETPGRKRKRRRVAALQKGADSNCFTRTTRRGSGGAGPRDARDGDARDPNAQDEGTQDEDIQDEDKQDEDTQNEDTQDEDIQDEDIQDEDIQDEDSQDEDTQDEDESLSWVHWLG